MTTEENPATETPVLYAEDENGSTVRLQLSRNRLYPRRFATMFDTTFQFMAGLDRPAAYYRTLMQCLAMMDPVQFRRISAREICQAAGMSHMSAQRGMAMLQADYVIFGQGKGAARSYRLNNRLVSMTSSEKWNRLDPDPEVIDARGR